jgi:hypothetical protein
MERGGAPIGTVSATPGNVTISRASGEISVRCERRGYQPGTVAMRASTEPMTHGNAFIGGLVGIAIDAASGAIMRYPGSVHVTLTPDLPVIRGNSRYDSRRREVISRATEQIAALKANCPGHSANEVVPSSCQPEIDAIHARRDSELQLIQEQEARSQRGARPRRRVGAPQAHASMPCT